MPNTRTQPTSRGEATRARLLAAARDDILARDGDMELTSVAKRAGVSPALPYKYFRGKSELLAAVVERYFDALDDATYRPTFAEVSGDWWVREQHRIAVAVRFFFDDPLSAFVLSRLSGDAIVLRTRETRLSRQVEGARRNIEAGQAEGRIPCDIDARYAAAMLMGGLHRAFAVAIERDDDPAFVTEQLQQLTANVLRIDD